MSSKSQLPNLHVNTYFTVLKTTKNEWFTILWNKPGNQEVDVESKLREWVQNERKYIGLRF
jgi:hypothetical protein